MRKPDQAAQSTQSKALFGADRQPYGSGAELPHPWGRPEHIGHRSGSCRPHCPTRRHSMITRLNGLVLALLATVLVIGAAQATPPVFVPAPIPDFTFPDAICGFPVQVHFTVNAETAKIFSDGTIIVTGPLVATYSANGKSVTLNISGPGIIHPSGTATGFGVQAGPGMLSNGEE